MQVILKTASDANLKDECKKVAKMGLTALTNNLNPALVKKTMKQLDANDKILKLIENVSFYLVSFIW